MSSMHLSRVPSPVMAILTPSDLAVRTSDLPLRLVGVALAAVGVVGVGVAEDCLRTVHVSWSRFDTQASSHEREGGKYVAEDAPGGLPAAVDVATAGAAVLVFCCFSTSTACFHFFTTSFAKSATAFD